MHVRAGEKALDEFVVARSVRQWADGATPAPDTEVTIPYLGHLPTDPVARGHWLALQRVLSPDESWLHLPQDVEWPVDVGELVTNAMPENADRFVALRERGVHATKR